MFTWPQRPFLVLCVWKLAFKVATRRHLQPHSPQTISGFSTLLLPPLLQTGQDLVIYTLDIYRKFPCLSLYFLLSSTHSETPLNLNRIIQAGVSLVINWNMFWKWADPVKKKKKRFGLNQWTTFTVHSVIFSYKTFTNSFHHETTTEVAGKLCFQFIAHCLTSTEIKSEMSTIVRVANCPVTMATCGCQGSNCILFIFVFSMSKFLHPPVATSLSI